MKEALQRACAGMTSITDAALNICYKVSHLLNTSEELDRSLHGYHKYCYSCFTVLPKSKQLHVSKTVSKASVLLRSMTKPSPSGTSGVFKAVCLFDCKWVTKECYNLKMLRVYLLMHLGH